jgi:hypothetical protein
MRENRTYGSEGGEAQAFPTPIDRVRCRDRRPGAGRGVLGASGLPASQRARPSLTPLRS